MGGTGGDVVTMERRTLGRTGLEVGVIGLGVEHLSTDRRNMDEVFDLAVSAGVEYVDLVYNDPIGLHVTEWEAITAALQRHRDHLTIAVHWGFIYHEPIDRCRKCFELVLDRLGNDYVEIAILTMVDSESLWQGWAQESIAILRDYQREGRVGFIGMSNHYANIARTAVESGSIDVLMFPVNLYQHHENGERLLHVEGRPTGVSPIQCLHYVLSQPVATVVPGPENARELHQALSYCQVSDDEKVYTSLHDELTERLRGRCVLCKHCLPCPQEINIPQVIDCLEWVEFYGPSHQKQSREWYGAMPAKASECTECGLCVERCPFQVDLIGKMKRAAEVFEGRA
jgi:predicted aldo/keto reductase-like oxidoreductase